MRAGLLPVVACGLTVTLALTGCTADARASDASRAAVAFAGADPAGACELLAPKTRATLEKDAGADCAAALTDLDLPTGTDVRGVEVAGESAQVRLADQTLFLARFPAGWRVTAAGCHRDDPDDAVPYECEVAP